MSTPTFAFVGAGEAEYFEWAEVLVWFERQPTAAEAGAIDARVPPPLRGTIAWTGALLRVASEQGVGRLITAAYARTPRRPSTLTTTSRFKMAPASAEARFEADIAGWLDAAHATVPITVAFRGEDQEAGGTRLSDWHRASVTQVPRLLERIAGDPSPALARLGVQLAMAARKAGGIALDEARVGELRRIESEAEAAEAQARRRCWEAELSAAAESLGEPAPRHAELRDQASLAAPLAALAQVMPAVARRLARQARAAGLAVRPGASAAAIAAAEAHLGAKVSREHRALLEAFDGGQLGEIVVLGTAKSGATGDAELVSFSRAWCGQPLRYAIVAHTGRVNVIAVPIGKPAPVFVLMGKLGGGGGSITRQCKSLDLALDLAIKAGEVWDNLAK